MCSYIQISLATWAKSYSCICKIEFKDNGLGEFTCVSLSLGDIVLLLLVPFEPPFPNWLNDQSLFKNAKQERWHRVVEEPSDWGSEDLVSGLSCVTQML